MTIASKLQNTLAEKKIAYHTIAHPRTFCSSDTALAAHVPDDHVAKGVLLKDRDGYLLAVIPASEWLDIHRVQAELDRDLHLAEEAEVERLFDDCEPGAVPPIGRAYGVDYVPLGLYAVFVPVVVTSYLLPSIQGWGVAQGVYVPLLMSVGVPAETALAISVTVALSDVVTGLLGGVVFVLPTRRLLRGRPPSEKA